MAKYPLADEDCDEHEWEDAGEVDGMPASRCALCGLLAIAEDEFGPDTTPCPDGS